ncbi:MAG TPA: GGDEF domain-containing protein [Labilithrix sp.]|nr:GGDEF domain-containing protein [Labilithrix sp.]
MLAFMFASIWHVSMQTTLVVTGLAVAVAFVVAGWELGRCVDRLSDEARRDPMTKVGNRRHWDECLVHEVERASKATMPLSLLMVDVDHLKKLNDHGGHGLGDFALSMVGEVLNDTCRSRDVPARFGGDEFAVLLPRTSATEAKVVAERIRIRLAQRRCAHGAPLSELLTVSIGIADLASIDEPLPHVLFEAADAALYAAKDAGRDRIQVFQKKTPASSGTHAVIILDERRRARKKHTP